MSLLVNATQMKLCDQYTIDTIGIPSMVLMERAALAVVDELKHGDYDLSQILIVCGSGNNGGDGYAIARLLHLAGYPVTILQVGSTQQMSPETQQQIKICTYYQIPVLHNIQSFLSYTLIVDSFLGIGATGKLRSEAQTIIQQLRETTLPIVAVDIPSGIDASTGESLGAYLTAVTTITFQFKKIGFTISPGMEACGKLVIADIGISSDALNHI